MAEGNGKNAKENANPDVHLAPASPRNGNRLRVGKGIGGVKGRSGRPRKAVRDMLVDEFAAQLPQLKREVTQGKLERIKFAELCAKYGMGTTITETDADGNDVPRPGVLSPDERRAALIRELSRN